MSFKLDLIVVVCFLGLSMLRISLNVSYEISRHSGMVLGPEDFLARSGGPMKIWLPVPVKHLIIN